MCKRLLAQYLVEAPEGAPVRNFSGICDRHGSGRALSPDFRAHSHTALVTIQLHFDTRTFGVLPRSYYAATPPQHNDFVKLTSVAVWLSPGHWLVAGGVAR